MTLKISKIEYLFFHRSNYRKTKWKSRVWLCSAQLVFILVLAMSSVDEYGRDTCRRERSPPRRSRQDRSPSCRRRSRSSSKRSSSFRRAIVVEGGFTLPQTHMDKSPHHGLRSRKVSPAPKLPLSKL